MKRYSKLISCILSLSMVCSILPARVFAEDLSNGSPQQESLKKEAKIVGEIESRREKNIKVFMKDDNTFEAAIYNEAVNYLEDGKWKEIDNSLIDANDEDKQPVVENKANDFKVKIAKKADAKKLVRIQKDKYELSWSLQNTSTESSDGVLQSKDLTDYNSLESNDKAKALLHNSSDIYFKNVFRNSDLQYSINGSTVKENIIINSKVDNPEYRFEIEAKKLVPKVQEDQSIVFLMKLTAKSQFSKWLPLLCMMLRVKQAKI